MPAQRGRGDIIPPPPPRSQVALMSARRTIEWESNNPPEPLKAEEWEYAAEDIDSRSSEPGLLSWEAGAESGARP